ncbi:MAG: pilus assembly PilX family protein [Pseudomonadota bacterium]
MTHPPRPNADQAGAALIVSLIMLLLMTILGLASVRNTALEEKMTANAYDRSLAFQAAEAGLRAGEAVAEAQAKADNEGFPKGNCACSSASGLCTTLEATCEGRWSNPKFQGWASTNKQATPLGDLAVMPEYFVEYLGENFPCQRMNVDTMQFCKRYRITARSAREGRASVMLQSIYATN